MDNVIDGRMTMVASTAGSTAQAMSSQCSNLNLHRCGTQMAVPSRKPTAILRDSLSNLRPSEELGTASSQAPESLLITAWSHLACSASSAALSKREDAVVSELLPSQFFSLHAP